MGLMGDGYRGTYQGHKIELIRDNLTKKLKLVIDGVEVASQPLSMQHDITLTATLVHEGASHRVVARSIVGRTTSGKVTIDGMPMTITKT
jgi:hypothetical protein